MLGSLISYRMLPRLSRMRVVSNCEARERSSATLGSVEAMRKYCTPTNSIPTKIRARITKSTGRSALAAFFLAGAAWLGLA